MSFAISAVDTARQVLDWAAAAGPVAAEAGPAADPAPGTDQAPMGTLRHASRLATPDRAVAAALQEVTRRTAARLGAGCPPFGDPSPIGLAALLIAAAVGSRAHPQHARMLLYALPEVRLTTAEPAGWSDAVARHGVAGAALTHGATLTRAGAPFQEDAPAGAGDGHASDGHASDGHASDNPASDGHAGDRHAGDRHADRDGTDEPLADLLLRVSPLTAVLHRPPQSRLASGTTGSDVDAARSLLARPRGRVVLSAALAAWSADPLVLRWRTELLTRLVRSDCALVVEVYAAARINHGASWDRQLAAAGRELAAGGHRPSEAALATIRFWTPLDAASRRAPALLRKHALLTGYDTALRLARRHRLTSAGAS